jgi:hypothetical protein
MPKLGPFSLSAGSTSPTHSPSPTTHRHHHQHPPRLPAIRNPHPVRTPVKSPILADLIACALSRSAAPAAAVDPQAPPDRESSPALHNAPTDSPSSNADAAALMSEHSAKRQRLTGSFSPASPPYHIAAKTTETKRPIVHPSTPTSPPYPPMSSQSNGRLATTATAAFSDMTPPSSVTMSQQVSQSGPSAAHPPPFPTPASMAGHSHSMNVDGDGDALMDDSQDEEAVRSERHRRSDHNRQKSAIFAPEGGVAAAKGVYGSQLFMPCQSSKVPLMQHTLALCY